VKRRSIVFCLTLCLSLATLVAFLPIRAQEKRIAPADNTLRLAGLRDRVTVRRDERGIPYIEAANETDLYFAQGYVTASDRLWQMDLLRRSARGELAEIFGHSALDEDKRHRIYGFAKVVDAEVAGASVQARAILEAYARGVNAFINSRDAKSWPLEFQVLQYRPRPWTPSDSLLVIKTFAEALNTTWDTDIMRAALARLPAEKRDALLPETSPLDVLVVGHDRARKKRAGLARPQPNPSLIVNCARVRPGSAGIPARKRAPARSSDLASSKFIAIKPIGSRSRAQGGQGCPRSQVRSRPIVRPYNQAGDAATLHALAEIKETTGRTLERLGLYAQRLAASNNWVVSGSRTASGKPLLANDPHLPSSAPSIWHMTHLSAPGLRCAGVTAPGLPGIIIGHNESIAWGFTNVGPDVQDLYLEKFDKENARRYMTPTGWREAEVRREEIKVRKAFASTETETITLDVTVTRHGPIIFEKNNLRYALRWTALDPKLNEAEGFHGLNRARNWKEFVDALSRYTGPMQNMVYADTQGHIGYYAAGRVPIRKSGDGSLPYDGGTDAGEWTGYIPLDKLPHVFDPPAGFIVTANQRIVGRDYPYHLTHEWPAPYRARRIHELLQAKQKLEAADFRAIQGDTYSIPGHIFAREVVRMARESNTTAAGDDRWPETLRLLEGWDGRVNADSRAAALAATMRAAFSRRIFAAALGAELAKEYDWANDDTLIDRIITERPREWLPKEFKDYAELLRACHTEARSTLTERLGADEAQWTWGGYTQARFPHPLDSAPLIGQRFLIPPFPQNGSGGNTVTVNVGRYVSMRFIADTHDWDKTQQGIALGQSGDPSSPHWKDQLDDWRNVTPRVFPFTDAAVASAAKATLVLTPATQ
jgi:penicillin amidase